jgi:hypothetical protein
MKQRKDRKGIRKRKRKGSKRRRRYQTAILILQ